MTSDFLRSKFESALSYSDYVVTGTDEQKRRWAQVYDAAKLSEPQRTLVASLTRPMHMLIVSGIWCGDCVQQCPLAARLAEANPERVALRFVDRDAHRDLIEPLRVNAGDRVPVAIFMAEDFHPCSIFGDRTLSRYRALAAKQLGAACPIALAPPDANELNATLQDWLNEFERVHLMLRLSGRLRQRHGD